MTKEGSSRDEGTNAKARDPATVITLGSTSKVPWFDLSVRLGTDLELNEDKKVGRSSIF